MRKPTYEIWIALIIILVISLIYLVLSYLFSGILKAGSLIGHSLGAIGFILMLSTETLYSIRKRQEHARWGSMSTWLQVHIITGLVGPYLVLLHTSFKFNGIAGFTFWLTVVVVVSGFVGRYLYTSLPRTAEGVEMDISAIEAYLAAIQKDITQPLKSSPLSLDREKAMQKSLKELYKQRDRLQQQLTGLTRTRRLLAVWHTLHVPITTALFLAAFVHSAAGIYFVVLGR